MNSEKEDPPETASGERVVHKTTAGNDNQNNSEYDYESEPSSFSLKACDRKKRKLHLKDGKTIHPKVTTISREVRELAKKQLELDRNLKIEGMPDPPKIRKRRMSVGSNIGRERDNLFKRKRLNSLDVRPKKDHVPKWALLGRDATDPLNLNGLADSEEGRLLNLKTPENSPLPTPDFRKIVFVKVPPNIEDPLNLEGKHDQRVIDMMLNATRKKRHRAKKNKDTLNQIKDEPPAALDSNVLRITDAQEMKKPLEECSSDSKLTNQPLNVKQRARSLSTSPERRLKRQMSGGKGVKHKPDTPTKFPENPKFTLGNYNRYYGYRHQDHEPDPRLRYFNPKWFHNKDILDIGCNVGHVTLAVAEQFSPLKILGVDIDGKLIGVARQNIRHILSQRRKDSSKYPSVFEITRGPLEAHPLMGSSSSFPNNVLFLQGNYVPESENILKLQKEEYDTILALSITKWVHLNNGDEGLKLFFQKIYRQLRPGGRLILEPQPWSTYRKRAKLSPVLFKRYSDIALKPEGFKNYLLSIGFVKCEVIGVPVTKAKGFRRPLILFTKADPLSSTLAQQNDTEIQNSFRVCTECSSGDQTMCNHIQSTGMRQGAYANRLYDRISYRSSGHMSSEYIRPMSFPSPISTSLDHFLRYRNSPFFMDLPIHAASPSNSFSAGPYSSNNSIASKDSERSQLHHSSESGSQSYSENDRSWTSDSSGSSSSCTSSSYSQSSGDSVSGLDDGPVVNGIGGDYSPEINGDIAADIQWVGNEDANLNFDNGVDEVPLNGGLINGHHSDDG